MATDQHTRILTSIWTDDDFTALSYQAQWLYFMVMSAPDRSLCGVADWRVNRIKARAQGLTPEVLGILSEELAAAYFIVIDEDTEEVLVRSFVRTDTLMKMPNMATAMVKAFQQVVSPRLRAVIVHELQRLHREDPTLKGWNDASLALLKRPSLDVKDESAGPSLMAVAG